MHKQSALEQDLDGFKQTVSATYQTIDAMSGYSTTEQMNAAISLSAQGITQTVSETYQTISGMSTYATKTYADGKASDAEQSANSYADGIGTAANAYADGIGEAANSYADGVGTAANAYADGVGTAANAYADGIGEAANSYADGIGEAANSYADGKAAEAETNANSYADGVGTAANAYADNKAAQAEQNAKDDTDQKLTYYYNKTEIDQTATAITTSIESAVNDRKTIIRDFNGGTLTAYVGNGVGVYTNASGSVEIVTLTWDEDEPTIVSTLASFGESINFSSDVPQYIGNENAYIMFDPTNNSLSIGGSNVRFSDSSLSDILATIDKANKQATLTISTNYSSANTVTLSAHLYNGTSDLITQRPASTIAWYARSESSTEPVKYLGTGRTWTYDRTQAGYGTSVVCKVYENEDIVIKTPDGKLLRTPDGKVLRGRIA